MWNNKKKKVIEKFNYFSGLGIGKFKNVLSI